MEIIISIVYYSYFVSILILLNIANQKEVEIKKIIGVICMHFLFEIFETSLKFTNIYFDLSSKIIHSFNVKDHNCFCRALHRLFGDNSSIKQWKYRVSMDIVLRIYISILVYSTKFLLIFVIKNSFNTNDNIYGYLGIVFGIQLIYYFMVYIIQLIFNEFNLFSLFVNYARDITVLQKISFIFLFVGGVIIF